MNDISKAIATTGIWISVAIILAFGVFRMNFSGDGSFVLLIVIPSIVLGCATTSTRYVWKK